MNYKFPTKGAPRAPFRANDDGFTLLELLVALAIFGVLAVMAYGGLRSVLDIRARSEIQAFELANLQRTLTVVERDIEQIVARKIRDSVDNEQPALRAEQSGAPLLEFTRTGWRNPAGHARSHLQRVAYKVAEGNLLRVTWAMLDQAQSSEPGEAILMGNIEGAELRFFDQDFTAADQWPPLGANGDAADVMPRAIEFSLDVKGWGRITRLFQVAEGTFFVPPAPVVPSPDGNPPGDAPPGQTPLGETPPGGTSPGDTTPSGTPPGAAPPEQG